MTEILGSSQNERPLCPLCGESDLAKVRVVHDRDQKLFRCVTCGMVFSVPLFGNISPPRYEFYYSELNLDERMEIQRKEYQWNFRQHGFYDYILTEIIAKHGKDISILDIGCGPGNFLDRAASAGICQCIGIEPQPHCVAFNRLQNRHSVVEGYYTREVFKPESFDVVYHSHVLEHVEFPVRFLRDNYYHLMPGGSLVMRVPSIRGPGWWLQVASRKHFWKKGPLNPEHLLYENVEGCPVFTRG